MNSPAGGEKISLQFNPKLIDMDDGKYDLNNLLFTLKFLYAVKFQSFTAYMMEAALLPPTIMWSRTLISNKSQAFF